MALIDIDHSKAVNDRHSHAVGDAVLRRLAALMQAEFGADAVLARYGGEEFVVVLPGCVCAEAIARCERLRRVVKDDLWGRIASSLGPSLSIGIAGAAMHADWERLLAAADHNLYAAKRTGRNRVIG